MGKTVTIEEEISLILDKIDNDEPLTIEEKILYQREVNGVKDENLLNFILNGSRLPKEYIPKDTNIWWEI
ncbi:MAG: hypothetical protein LBE82_04655 [Chitinophagaceae bacterium]|jgi:hypothetical protein|nr:hypothetical protein [Chitinophagaceae bacterium]